MSIVLSNGQTPKKPNTTLDLITTGSEAIGAGAGSVLGFLSTGPSGVVLGGVVGALVARSIDAVAHELMERMLSERETIRIGATLGFAAQKIQSRLDAGQTPRDDGFFRATLGERTASEELLEHVLIVAQREPQEKKLFYYGNLLANLVFDSTYGRDEVYHLVSTAAALSYRQLCLLALLVKKDMFNLRKDDYREVLTEVELAFLLQEIYDLYNLGMLFKKEGFQVSDLSPPMTSDALLSPGNVAPSNMHLQGIGQSMYDLMELKNVQYDDLDALAKKLR